MAGNVQALRIFSDNQALVAFHQLGDGIGNLGHGAQAAGGLPCRLAILALAAIASAQGSFGGVQVD